MDIQITFGGIILMPTVVASLLVVSFLIIFFIMAGITIKRADPTKSTRGFMFILEVIYNALEKFIGDSVGDKANKFIPFITAVAFYLGIANLLGLIGLTPPATDINITVALTVVTLTYIMFVGIFSKGFGRYLKETYLGDVPKPMLILFIPINIVGELSKIISLSFRLFGNIVSGTLLLGLFLQVVDWLFSLLPLIAWVPVLLLPFLNAFFDIFAGLMQTFIFCTLVMMWIKTASERAT